MKNRPGTYVLILHAPVQFSARIGKLGQLTGPAGYYLYSGSAFGPGGIASRLKHHQRIAQRPHWHIDYLRRELPLVGLWYSYDPVKREHDWASILSGLEGASFPMTGFGSSDCNCASHLIYSPNRPDIACFREQCINEFQHHEPIQERNP